jgi:hypothetical protein
VPTQAVGYRFESVIGDPGEQVGKPSSRADAVELAAAISVADHGAPH